MQNESIQILVELKMK